MTGATDEDRELLLAAYEDFRTELNGKEGKGWETVKVIRMGEEKVHDAIRKLAGELNSVVPNLAAPKTKTRKKAAAAKVAEADSEVEAEEATSEA